MPSRKLNKNANSDILKTIQIHDPNKTEPPSIGIGRVIEEKWKAENDSLKAQIQLLQSSYEKDYVKIKDLETQVLELKYLNTVLQNSVSANATYIKEDETVSKIHQIIECDERLDAMGIAEENRHVFKEKLISVVKAVNSKTIIENINISEAVRNPNFRFYTKDEPILSLELSNSYADFARSYSNINPNFMAYGRDKRTEKADDFAREMHKTISEISAEEKLTSFTRAAKVLNERKIRTPLDKEWHARTLQDLSKRWEVLGLSSLIPKPK